MQDSIVRLERASKSFALPEGGTIAALDGVDLAVRRNEFLTLLGPSGCGKTTLLHAISGFVDLDAGRILLDGVDVTRLPPYRRPVNTVFQNYALFPHMSVGDNTGYALDVAGVDRDERRRRVQAALCMVGLDGLENRRPRQLSGGQQQRVALARAIVARPKLLLLDEPLSALDRNLRQAMQLELKTLQHELGISFIFVTHDQEEALTMSDRVAVLDRGVVQQLDTPRAIYDRPANPFVATFVGASNLFAGRLDGHRVITREGEAIQVDDPGEGAAEVQALIRPERFTLAGEGPALDVTVDRIVFVGSVFELLARTASGRRVTAEIPAGQQTTIAEVERAGSARLHYDPAAVHLIRATRSDPGT